MIKSVLKNKKEIIVTSCIKQKFLYKNKSFESYFINDEFRLNQGDKITYQCDICDKIEYNKLFKKHHLDDLLCSKCQREQTNLKKYGVKSTNSLENTKNKAKESFIKKYGVENPAQSKQIKEKTKQINLKKYGVNYPTQSEQIKEKTKQTNLKKYGVESVLKSEEIREKIKETSLKKYGVNYPTQSEQIKEKIKQTNLERYGVENSFQIISTRQKLSDLKINDSKEKIKNNKNYEFLLDINEYNGILKKYKWKCKKCYLVFYDDLTHGGPYCPKCYPNSKSLQEKAIADYLKLYINNIVENSRSIIPPQELDIYLPDHNIAIEYDGLYWHSEQLGTNKNYHLNKTLECEKQGIRLIHIFEDEWINKQEIVKARLRNILGLNTNRIGARKTIIKEISSKEKDFFLNEYHIQGADKSNIKLGAYYQDRLIGVMTFSKPRIFMNNKKIKNNSWELSRFATISDTWTPGLASKLLKYFENNYEWEEVYSYADRRWSQGDVYKQLGFDFEKITAPNYWYFQNQKRFHRYTFRKNNLKNLKNYSDNKTEYEIMDEAGWLRIYDCGNYKFVKKI